MKTRMITLTDISKSYGKTAALRNVSLNVDKGELFGLIGPDGSGKTTLFRILTTLLLADHGEGTINGWDLVKDMQQIRNSSGYMPGRFSLYGHMTVEENLQFFASIFKSDIKANYRLVADIYDQIAPFKDRRADKLSGGMKQKLALSCALIHKPLVLFLDEPTTGIDPVSRKELWAMLRHLGDEGITIVVSTPYMDEALMCDRIALMQNGQILQTDTPTGITNHFDSQVYAIESDRIAQALFEVRALKGVKSCYSFGNALHVVMEEGASPDLISQQLPGLAPRPIDATIEDCFIALQKS